MPLELLLSALVNCPRTASPWLILETNWYSRDCQDAWFAFGGHWTPCSLARLRARSSWRDIEREMTVYPAFSQQGQYFSHAFESSGGQDIGSKLEEVRQCRVFAYHEEPLAKPLE